MFAGRLGGPREVRRHEDDYAESKEEDAFLEVEDEEGGGQEGQRGAVDYKLS